MRMKRFVLLVSMLSAIVMTGCDLAPSFSEYAGESFLVTDSLSSEGWELMPDYDFTADGAGTADEFDYMDFTEEVGEAGPAGGLGGPVYRLEIKNLLDNGDFNVAATTPWEYYDKVALAAEVAAALPEMDCSGNDGVISLVHDSGIEEERLLIKFSDAFINTDTYVANKSYFFGYSYTNSFYLYYIPGWDYSISSPDLDTGYFYQAEFGGGTYPPAIPEVIDVDEEDNINVNRFTASDSPDNDVLAFAGTTQSGTIDDFSIVRSPEGDFDLKLRLKLYLDHRADLEMISGYYKFSVWVKEDPTAGLGTDNTFHADRVELGINGYDEDNHLNVDDAKVFYKTQDLADTYATSTGTYSGDWSSGWVLLEFASNKLIQLPDESTNTVMELTISPSNPGSSDSSWNRLSSGSILIADPTLEYTYKTW